jgi:uncharacterized membrane protein
MSCPIANKQSRLCRYAGANAVYAMLTNLVFVYVNQMATLTSRNNLLGIAALCCGALVFSLQDSVIKSISGEHAVTLAIVLRAIVSFPIIVAMVAVSGGIRELDTPHWKVMVLRGIVLLCAYTTYFMAFPALPLAEAIALYFMVPLLITVMSGPLLGEHVTAKAWGAVFLGLVGVFVILKPGMGLFEPAARQCRHLCLRHDPRPKTWCQCPRYRNDVLSKCRVPTWCTDDCGCRNAARH